MIGIVGGDWHGAEAGEPGDVTPGQFVELDIQMYAGVTIRAEPGTHVIVEYTTNAATGPWKYLDELTVSNNLTLYVDTNSPGHERRFYRTFTAPTNYVWIPPGTFTIGSPEDEVERWYDEGPQTLVTLTHGFWMSKFEITQREYEELVGDNPSFFRGNPELPVDSLSWFNATNFCFRLTERERAAGRLPDGFVYRLPTEAEWEYACRAGTTTPFHYGPDLRSGMANFDGRVEYVGGVGSVTNEAGVYLKKTTVGGTYAPNAWGLYDMHGNNYEWCWDWFIGHYPGGHVIDPIGPPSGTDRVLRGGSFRSPAWVCRSAFRGNHTPDITHINQTVRPVLARPLPVPQ